MIDPLWLLDSLAHGVVAVGRGLRVSYMNQAAEVLFETSAKRADGAPFDTLAGGTERLVASMRCCLANDTCYVENGLRLHLHGRRSITVNATVAALSGRGAAPQGLTVVLQQVDQHLRFNREEQLMAQQQTSKLLARNLAHEIKNPLGGLRGAAQLLQDELPAEHLKEYTDVIIGEADRLTDLVDRMLGPNRPPRLRALNVHEVLQRVRALALAECGAGIVVAQDYDPSIPPLIGDRDQLLQAILNIVRNAVQALQSAPPGTAAAPPTVTLRTRVQRQGTIGPKRHRLLLKIDISDNGPGIPETLAEDIFFPTISGRQQGTGLGLSIAQSIVAAHGGLIEYASRPGETAFTLLLPLETPHG